MKSFIEKLKRGVSFTGGEIHQVFELLLDPKISEEDIKVFLLELSKIPITVDWLVEAATVLREKAIKVPLGDMEAIDTAGTGGDQSGSFNFSTAAALLAAACGVPVAKHGNRSITSKCGSADFLEALGIPIEDGPEQVAASIKENNFGFMLAPRYHPAAARVQKVRRELGRVTLFNFLGPLINPAGVKRQVVGVFDNGLRPVIAESLRRLGARKAWVVCGEDGLDEITLGGVTYVSEVVPDGILEKTVTPEDAVLRRCDPKFLKGGDGPHNAKILEGIFAKSFFGPLVNGVLLNTAAALVLAGRVEDLKEGVAQARLAIENGEGIKLLERLRARQ
jgi:anthranilate phosphoribosyltransferase